MFKYFRIRITPLKGKFWALHSLSVCFKESGEGKPHPRSQRQENDLADPRWTVGADGSRAKRSDSPYLIFSLLEGAKRTNKTKGEGGGRAKAPSRCRRTWKHLLEATSSGVTSQNLAETVSLLEEESQRKTQSTLTSWQPTSMAGTRPGSKAYSVYICT